MLFEVKRVYTQLLEIWNFFPDVQDHSLRAFFTKMDLLSRTCPGALHLLLEFHIYCFLRPPAEQTIMNHSNQLLIPLQSAADHVQAHLSTRLVI